MAMIHLYHGDGKGKTTAALGLALRAYGAGYCVVIAQFLKSQPSSELASLGRLAGVRVVRSDGKYAFTWALSETQQQKLRAEQDVILERALDALPDDGRKTLLVLDEAVSAYTYRYLAREPLLAFLRALPEHVEVVLTGRNPEPEMLELADYITEMKKIRHPFDRGVTARTGIEN